MQWEGGRRRRRDWGTRGEEPQPSQPLWDHAVWDRASWVGDGDLIPLGLWCCCSLCRRCQLLWAKGHVHPGVLVARGFMPVHANLWVGTYKLILIDRFLEG